MNANPNATMSTISTFIKHLKQLTAHRDHTLLDIAAVAALHELVGASQARVLKIARIGEYQFVQPQVWIRDSQVVSMEESLDSAERGEPLENYPTLVECIEQRLLKNEHTETDGHTVMWLPVWINDRAQTCLEVTNARPYSGDALQIMEGILSVYRSYQSLLDYSERDSLTGLFNRKTFDEKFAKISAGSENGGTAWDDGDTKKNWIAVLDIDHFKRVNDQFGHLYGDEVLLLIANLLQASFRGYDKIFRFGGEEFVILLRSTTLPNARRIFNRFRQRVEQHNFPQVGQVTVSLGFREMANMAPAILLGEVDQALYYAKEHGRNQVCHYEDLVAQGLLKQETMASDVELF